MASLTCPECGATMVRAINESLGHEYICVDCGETIEVYF